LAEYVLKGSKPWDAKIFSNDKLIAEIKKGENLTLKIINTAGHEWIITRKVHGQYRPFSISIFDQDRGVRDGQEVFTIREHLFKHNGRFYMLINHPEGRHWNDYLSGPRYISRLDNFPYSDLTELDHHIKHRLKRFRGVPVGEASGLGTDSHYVKVDKELEDIGLFVSVSSYLIYSTT
jgi:hypothetical protein